MEYRHTPVLLAEVTQQLTLHDGSIFVDCTLGGAGHTKRIAQLVAPTGIVVGIDQDDAALTACEGFCFLGLGSPERANLDFDAGERNRACCVLELRVGGFGTPYDDGVLLLIEVPVSIVAVPICGRN